MENRYTYRLETPADWAAAEALTREAFWNVYKPGCDEHYILHIMRGKPAVAQELNTVCTEGEAVRGHIFYTHTAVVTEEGEARPVLSFGPISVDPARQGQGIGSHLIRMTLRQAAEAGHAGVVITGNPAYYSRFGFRPASDFGIVDQDGASYPELMALELGPQRLAGLQRVDGAQGEERRFHQFAERCLVQGVQPRVDAAVVHRPGAGERALAYVAARQLCGDGLQRAQDGPGVQAELPELAARPALQLPPAAEEAAELVPLRQARSVPGIARYVPGPELV